MQHGAAEQLFRAVKPQTAAWKSGTSVLIFGDGCSSSQDSLTEQGATQTLILMEVWSGESSPIQGTVSTRKRARPDSSDGAMKRQRKEQTRVQDMSSCGNPVHGTRQKLKPSLPTFPGGWMQASHLESPHTRTPVGEATMGERATKSKKEGKRREIMCEHQRQRSQCKECKGGSICEHQRRKSECNDCTGSSICEHQRIRSRCKECKGSSICEHQRIRSSCKECGGSSISLLRLSN